MNLPDDTIVFDHPGTASNQIISREFIIDANFMKVFYGKYSTTYDDLRIINTMVSN